MITPETPTITTPAAYEAAYLSRQPATIAADAPLMGRIARYRPQVGEQFERLAPDGRPLVFAMGVDGLNQLLGQPMRDALAAISISPAYVEQKIAQGYSYELAVFTYPEKGDIEARRATWPNVLAEVAAADPALAPDIRWHAAELQQQPFSFYQEQLGEDMNVILGEGESHADFMSTERYHTLPRAQRAGSLALRQLLACEYRLHPTFDGSGYTIPENGAPGLREYVLPNWRFDPRLPDAVQLPLNP